MNAYIPIVSTIPSLLLLLRGTKPSGSSFCSRSSKNNEKSANVIMPTKNKFPFLQAVLPSLPLPRSQQPRVSYERILTRTQRETAQIILQRRAKDRNPLIRWQTRLYQILLMHFSASCNCSRYIITVISKPKHKVVNSRHAVGNRRGGKLINIL